MNLIQAVKSLVNKTYDQYSTISATDQINSNTVKAVGNFKELMHKAAKNLHFRIRLLDNPVATLAQNHFNLPPSFNLKFVEDKENLLHIPIPPFAGEFAIDKENKDHEKLQIVIQKAISNLEFRQALVAHPTAVLIEEGFILPASLRVTILESTDDLIYVVLPPFSSTIANKTKNELYCNMTDNTVSLAGRIDTETIAILKDFLERHIKNQSIIIDMADVYYISSVGLGLLLYTRKRLKKEKLTMQIVNLKDTVRNVFVLSGFDKIFEI